MKLPDGLVAFVKRDCPTCVLVTPVLDQLKPAVYAQDDPAFFNASDDTSLDLSYAHNIETVPTLLRVESGVETGRVIGWSREQWEAFTGVGGLGAELPAYQPGCASRTLDPAVTDELTVRFAAGSLRSRRIELGDQEDEVEAAFDRGWSDGLPLVPPTPARVLRMLGARDPNELVAVVPPNLAECTVEKVAINAVMAGCKPEYLPVVLAAVRAACTDEFNAHGVLATLSSVGPIVVVNGPIAKAIGMNSGRNALGQGNRANATIGRALQLVIRNVGGGKPGEVDRAVLGNPGKYTACFAEDEDGSPWEPLHVERGFAREQSTVTLFAGEGPRSMIDQGARSAGALVRSFAACLKTVMHPKLAMGVDAMIVAGPEHARLFREAGWTKDRVRTELVQLMMMPAAEVVKGAGGMDEGLPPELANSAPMWPKFTEDGLVIVHAGGLGPLSGIIGGWAKGAMGSTPVTREVTP